MKLIDWIQGSSAKWYLLGIATAVAAGWIARESKPTPLAPDSTSGGGSLPVPSPEAIELVHTARAHEREGDSVQARADYLKAAAQLPPIGDYLRLRAAQLTPDSSERQQLYRGVTSSPAQDQVRVAEARLLERMGDLEGAVRQRAQLGQFAEVFRLRLMAAGDRAARRPVLTDLVSWVRDSTGSHQRSAVAAAALPFFKELPARDVLSLARASKTTGTAAAPAVAFFTAASASGGRLTTADFAAWGEGLYSSGKYREAVTRLGRVTSGPLVPRSMLLRGRAMLRSGQAGGKRVLDDLVRRFPSDTSSTPTALFLLADLARDVNDLTTARRRWNLLGERFPSSAEAPRARFLVGLVQYAQGQRIEAARHWASLLSGGSGREEALSAGYWAGRAFFEVGDSARAHLLWRQVIARSRLSYYSRLSYRRLGLDDSTLMAGNDGFDASANLVRARERLNLLAATGLSPELGMEITWLAAKAGDDLPNVLATGSLLRDFNRAALSAQLGWRALEAGAAESRTYRLIFPLMFELPLVSAARAKGIEPALAAALIRQESLFDSMATSRAGARGLMQIMPSVGRALARSARKPAWHADSLYQPVLNLELGNAHLAWALGQYGGLERTLAAYNAGGSRVTRWARFPAGEDAEVFVEWIPYPETRNYVRTVLRNLEFYRRLYNW